MNWIEEVCEPQRLILAWQAPDHFCDRFRWAVGEIVCSDSDYVFRYFDPKSEFEHLNQGKKFEALLALGYQGYPAFDRRMSIHKGAALAAFLRRVPRQTRSDFADYRRHFRIGPSTTVSDFALLGITEAKLPSDGFSLVNPLEEDLSRCELFLEVAGYRYYAKEAPMPEALGEAVELNPEPDNRFDPNAVMILVRGIRIGYINRLQTGAFLRWIAERRVSGTVERLNGNPERPRAFIFVRVSPREERRVA